MPQTPPAIPNYEDQTAEEIKQRLRKLSQDELAKLETYERQGQARSTVLEAIAALRTDAPWAGYDDMEVEQINDALKQRDSDAASRVLDYERHHKGRTTIIDFAKRRREESNGSQSAAARSSTAQQAKSPEGGPRSQSETSSRARPQARKPSTAQRSQSQAPAIADYDDHTAGEIAQRLRKLSQDELAELAAYEKQGQGRRTVLETIAALRGDEPWSGYDGMEAEEVSEALRQRDGETAGRVLEYERRHKGRKTVIELAKARRQSSAGSSAPASRSPASKGSQARSRSQSSKSSSTPKRTAGKKSSATLRGASAGKPASGSSRGASTKAAPPRTRAKTTARPSATRSSGSKQTKSSPVGSRRMTRPESASRSKTQVKVHVRQPSATTRSSESESRVKEALQAVGTRLKERATEALKSAEAPTKRLAKETGHAVGTAAHAAPAKIKDRAAETLQNVEGPTKKLAKDTGNAVESAVQTAPAKIRDRAAGALANSESSTKKQRRGSERNVGAVALGDREAGGEAARGSGQAVTTTVTKAITPALVGAATLATVGGGIALASKVKLRRRRRVLGVPVPRQRAVGKAAKRVAATVDSVSSTGQQIGQWSDDLQYLRHRMAGGRPVAKQIDGDSAVSAGRATAPRGLARRILC